MQLLHYPAINRKAEYSKFILLRVRLVQQTSPVTLLAYLPYGRTGWSCTNNATYVVQFYRLVHPTDMRLIPLWRRIEDLHPQPFSLICFQDSSDALVRLILHSPHYIYTSNEGKLVNRALPTLVDLDNLMPASQLSGIITHWQPCTQHIKSYWRQD